MSNVIKFPSSTAPRDKYLDLCDVIDTILEHSGDEDSIVGFAIVLVTDDNREGNKEDLEYVGYHYSNKNKYADTLCNCTYELLSNMLEENGLEMQMQFESEIDDE